MNRNDHFVERLIHRDTMTMGLVAKAEQDVPIIRPVLTPDMIPDRFHYSQQDKSDQPASSLGIVPSLPQLPNNNKNDDSNLSSKSKSKNNNLENASESLDSSIKKVQSHELSQQQQPIQPSTMLSPSFSSKDNNLTTNKKNVLNSSDDLVIGDVDKDNQVSPEAIYRDDITHDYPLKTKKNGKSSSSSASSAFTYNNANLSSVGSSKGSGVEIPSKPPDQDSSSASSSSILSPISPKKYSPIAEANLGVSSSEPTTVTINIGRIEVRAVMQQKPPPSVATIQTHSTPSSSISNPSPALSLKDYLRQRSEGLY